MRDYLYCDEIQLAPLLREFKTAKIYERTEEHIPIYEVNIDKTEYDEKKYLKCLIKSGIVLLSLSVQLKIKVNKLYEDYLNELSEEMDEGAKTND